MTPDERDAWVRRNAAVTALANAAAGFRWPREVLEAVSDQADARDVLRTVRENYQQLTASQLRAYRLNRNQGDTTEADGNIVELSRLNEAMASRVRAVTVAANRSVLETVAHTLDDARSSALNSVRAIGSGIAEQAGDVRNTASLWLVLAAIAAVAYFGRK